MKATLTDREALLAVSPAALRAYLEFEGWRKERPFGRFGQIYASEGPHGPSEIPVPFTNDVADYASSVLDIIAELSDIEGRDQLAIYRDLVGSDREVIRIRAPKADDDGSVEIEEGVDLVLNARDLMASAACSAHDPRAAYHLGKVVKATEYMKKVRLGQTERGSYVVTLLAPVPPAISPKQIEMWPEMEEEPFERQVTRTLSSAMYAVQDAIHAINRGEGEEVLDRSVKFGVSANLCEALGNLVERGRGIDVSVTWARTRPTPEARSKIQFHEPAAEILKEAARHLRQCEPRRDERIFGYVVRLGREQEQEDGEVTFKTLIDGHTRSMKAALSAADYVIAYAAHGDRIPVSLTGDIDTRARPWRLTQVRDLRIIDDAPEAA